MLHIPSILTQKHLIKLTTFVLVAGLSSMGLFWYINQYLYDTSASSPVIEAAVTAPDVVSGGQEFNVAVELSGQSVSATDMYLVYDRSQFEYFREYASGSGISVIPTEYFTDPIIEEFVSYTNNLGVVHVTLVNIGDQGGPSVRVLFKFRAKQVKSGESDMFFYTSYVEPLTQEVSTVVGPDASGNATYFDITPQNPRKVIRIEPNPTPSVSPVPTGIFITPQATTTPIPTVIPQATLTPIQTATPVPSATIIQRLTPTAVPSATSSPNTPQGSAIQLQVKTRFQGVTTQPREEYRTLNGVITLETASGKPFNAPLVLTAQSDGTFTGTASFDTASGIVPGDGYVIYIKGPKHIRKKVCTLAPTEQTAGGYTCGSAAGITLRSGLNTLDFSRIYLLAGDVPVQNGVVDSRDIIAVRSKLGSSSPGDIAVADLNFDGIVDSQDYTLVLSALGFKYDEE